jgi:hypothetical protein
MRVLLSRATPRYVPRVPRGQVNPFPKESLTKLPGPAVDPAGSPRGGGTLNAKKWCRSDIYSQVRIAFASRSGRSNEKRANTIKTNELAFTDLHGNCEEDIDKQHGAG